MRARTQPPEVDPSQPEGATPGSGMRALLLPTASYVLGITAQSTFLFFLVPAYAQAFGVGHLQLAAFAVTALATTAVGVPAGRFTDHVPRRYAMALGWAILGVGILPLIAAPRGGAALLGSSALVGVGLAFGFTAFQSYVADVIRSHDLPRAYGATGAVAVLASAAGPFLCGGLLRVMGGGAAGLDAAALLLAVLGLLGAALAGLLGSARTARSAPGITPRVGLPMATLRAFQPAANPRTEDTGFSPTDRRLIVAYATAWVFLGLGYGLTAPWMGPDLMERFGATPAAWAALLGWGTLWGAAGIYLGGALGNRAGLAFPLAVGSTLLTSLAVCAFALVGNLLLAGWAFHARMFFGSVAAPLLNAGLMRGLGSAARGRGFGIVNVVWNLTWAAGAALGGLLLTLVGPWTFIAGALLLALGPLAAWMLQRQMEPPLAPNPLPLPDGRF